ncbi:OLC1v1025145C1 [Oldenlandia corymbosa var. corymbosa]|uniref:OLC1v1025145C1 n=1 Tax=Oldenlandia corymbosa var. corymbosa TaxID=529605 RepID=A0AAV1C4Q3_OLDCO|nr:OLC1v1025145C1 [Oldenlandia corymbosa var. corymbosa]
MSVLQYPEGMNSSDLQIWNNAAFDNGDSEDLSAIGKRSWSPLKPVLLNSTDSIQSLSCKENQSPQFLLNSSISSVKSPLPLRPKVNNNSIVTVEDSRIKPAKVNSKMGLEEKSVSWSGSDWEVRDEGKIDKEIEEIEMEINRLSSRLEELKMQKAERSAKLVEKRGFRVVPAKFMEEKKIFKNTEEQKKTDEILGMSARTKVQRRGLSLGPAEIMAGTRRGLSLGPSEIYSGLKSKEMGKKESVITPIQPIQSRRKSCFWKLQDIDEEKVTKERGKCLTVSPKLRKNLVAKAQTSRQAATTVASKKTVKKEELFGTSVQPKKLFKDGEKSITATSKKPTRPGRVVASRYNQSSSSQASAIRKRSLPENDKDESKRCDKKRSLSLGKSSESLPETKNLVPEIRVKKKWQIPSDIVVHSSESDDLSPTISDVPDPLPRIRTTRCAVETPRDSGPAKRVADLVGRKSCFADSEEEETSLRQVLNFAEDDILTIRTTRCIKETPRDSGPAKRVADLVGRKKYFADDEEEDPSMCQFLNFADDEVEGN